MTLVWAEKLSWAMLHGEQTPSEYQEGFGLIEKTSKKKGMTKDLCIITKENLCGLTRIKYELKEFLIFFKKKTLDIIPYSSLSQYLLQYLIYFNW